MQRDKWQMTVDEGSVKKQFLIRQTNALTRKGQLSIKTWRTQPGKTKTDNTIQARKSKGKQPMKKTTNDTIQTRRNKRNEAR